MPPRGAWPQRRSTVSGPGGDHGGTRSRASARPVPDTPDAGPAGDAVTAAYAYPEGPADAVAPAQTAAPSTELIRCGSPQTISRASARV
ncbi:hypothetical protein GCM10010297_42200 [Streptomyces malachitofuscus]|nr:hypothetical protein GCM10010297_42200 [Streptomyces malachitofuscus]